MPLMHRHGLDVVGAARDTTSRPARRPAIRRPSERWRVVIHGTGTRGWECALPVEAGWSGAPRDARRGGDVQGAVGIHPEAPAACEGLEPVVGAAQAAEVV